MRTYVAEYEYDGRAWVVQFHDPDISTFGRTLRSAKRYARELLGAYLELDDLADAGVEVVDEISLPVKVEVGVDRLGAMRRDIAAETRRATQQLRGAGLSTRDVGEILGVSAARVAQIERETAGA